jgi:hypothetical protein
MSSSDNEFSVSFGSTGGGTSSGGVATVTGLNTDNTDPLNPIVQISVDGSTITGVGTPASPLVANSNFVNSVTGLNTDNTDPLNPIVNISVDGSTITGAGTPASPLVATIDSNKVLVSYHMNNNFNITSNSFFYFGQQSSVGSNLNTAIAVPIPEGTIVEVITNTYVAGTFGTSEGSTLTIYSNTNSLTPTTDLVTNNVQFATGNPRNFSQSFSGLNIPVVLGGSIIEIATPTFITAPSSGVIRVSIIIEI